MSASPDSSITIALLDPLRGHAIRTWEFVDANLITIGRSANNDIVLSDMLVSRVHGELRKVEGAWQIIPLGRNGIIMEGRPISGWAALRDDNLLRLGSDGPQLEIYRGPKRNEIGPRHRAFTAPVDDEKKRAADTNITETDLLQSLRKQAGAISKHHNRPEAV